MGIASNSSTKLCANKYKSVLLVVALLVEGLGAEAMLGTPEQPLQPLDLPLFVEDLAEEGKLVLF